MPLTRLAAYVRALERRGWRAWATGYHDLVRLHASARFAAEDGRLSLEVE